MKVMRLSDFAPLAALRTGLLPNNGRERHHFVRRLT